MSGFCKHDHCPEKSQFIYPVLTLEMIYEIEETLRKYVVIDGSSLEIHFDNTKYWVVNDSMHVVVDYITRSQAIEELLIKLYDKITRAQRLLLRTIMVKNINNNYYYYLGGNK